MSVNEEESAEKPLPAVPKGAAVREDRDTGRFILYLDDEIVGHLRYRMENDEMWLLETIISRPHRIENLVPYLLSHALQSARARKLAVVPQSPAVREFMDIYPPYWSLVPVHWRTRLKS